MSRWIFDFPPLLNQPGRVISDAADYREVVTEIRDYVVSIRDLMPHPETANRVIAWLEKLEDLGANLDFK